MLNPAGLGLAMASNRVMPCALSTPPSLRTKAPSFTARQTSCLVEAQALCESPAATPHPDSIGSKLATEGRGTTTKNVCLRATPKANSVGTLHLPLPKRFSDLFRVLAFHAI